MNIQSTPVSVWGLAVLLVFSVFSAPTQAVDKQMLSNELTTLYRSARAVISANQKHINDSNIGDKGLSADAVVKQARTNFQKAMGKSLDMSTDQDAKQAMLDSVAAVMNEAQELINEKGKGFKGFLPAIFARQVASQFNTAMKGKMRLKLTAPKNYVRNRANRPDKWEHKIIESKFRDASYEKGKPFSETVAFKGRDAYRFILPEYYKQSCLGCHGEPKGEKDITGGKKEGGKLGELGGAISLVIFK